MSWLGTIFAFPVAVDVQLFGDIINIFASLCAFKDNGIWIPIWSPSKSALNAEHTKGWSFIVFLKVILGKNACIPTLCNVGARFSNIG